MRQNGLDEKEITVNPPSISDLEAREWGDNQKNFRYIVTTTITVATNKVKEVNAAIFKQAELLKQGVAIENSSPDYEYASFQKMKPEMMAEAIKNAQKTAEQEHTLHQETPRRHHHHLLIGRLTTQPQETDLPRGRPFVIRRCTYRQSKRIFLRLSFGRTAK